MNPLKYKSMAEQRQIAEKQRQEQVLRNKALEQSVEAKKKLLRTETELFKEKQRREAEHQKMLLQEELKRQQQKKNQEKD